MVCHMVGYADESKPLTAEQSAAASRAEELMDKTYQSMPACDQAADWILHHHYGPALPPRTYWVMVCDCERDQK
jgi:hypothetical protein